MTVETEFAFRYTKLAGEYTRDILTTTTGESVTAGWYFQGQQTLTPRWFAAARVERIGATVRDPLLTPTVSSFLGAEETLGYRLTPDLTFRVQPPRAPGVRADRTSTTSARVDRLGAAVVLKSGSVFSLSA